MLASCRSQFLSSGKKPNCMHDSAVCTYQTQYSRALSGHVWMRCGVLDCIQRKGQWLYCAARQVRSASRRRVVHFSTCVSTPHAHLIASLPEYSPTTLPSGRLVAVHVPAGCVSSLLLGPSGSYAKAGPSPCPSSIGWAAIT